MKRCQNCGKELEKHKHKWCGECSREIVRQRSRKRYQRNRQKYREYYQKYRQKPGNREKAKIIGKEYYKKNKEKIRKQYNETHIYGSIAGRSFGVYTDGYTELLRPMVKKIKHDVLEDATRNPRKYLGRYKKPRGKKDVYRKRRLHEKF